MLPYEMYSLLMLSVGLGIGYNDLVICQTYQLTLIINYHDEVIRNHKECDCFQEKPNILSQFGRYVACRNSRVLAKLKEAKRKRISTGTSYPGSGMCRDAMVAERFHELLKEMEMLKLSLFFLNTYTISPKTDRGSPMDKERRIH